MPIEIHLPLRDAAKSGTAAAKNARIDVRVLRSGGGRLELEMHGRKFEAPDPGGLAEGDHFKAQVERTGTHLILRRLDADTATIGDANTQTNAMGRLSSGVADRALDVLRDKIWNLKLAGEAGTLVTSLRGLLVAPFQGQPANAESLAKLFSLFGIGESGIVDKIRERASGPGPLKQITRLLTLPLAAWSPDGNLDHKGVESIRSRFASLSQWLESSDTANRLLRSLDQPLYLQWPLLGDDEAAVRMTYQRNDKEGDEKSKATHRHVVEMMIDTTGLGEVRLRLAAMPGIDVTIRSRASSLASMENMREPLESALAAIAEPVIVRFSPLAEDEPPFPDLSNLLARAKGDAGRLRVLA